MNLLIDMNLSPMWCPCWRKLAWRLLNGTVLARPDVPDYEILTYAKSNGYVVFTHDLDFGTILAATKADYPSVIQVCTQNVTPDYLGPLLVSALHQLKKHLEDGAIVTIDQKKLRVRIFPS